MIELYDIKHTSSKFQRNDDGTVTLNGIIYRKASTEPPRGYGHILVQIPEDMKYHAFVPDADYKNK